MTPKEFAINQIELQHEIQKAGFNIVTCGNCGSIVLHRTNETIIKCFCGDMDASDCPDYWYTGCENNEEFES
jgi:formylmethanofuran dehydrogenase subunit E